MVFEDSDFQTLKDKFFKVLGLALALCAALVDLSVFLLSYVYRTIRTVSQTPMETLWHEFLTVFVVVKDYVFACLITAIMIILALGAVIALCILFLNLLGFRKRGVRRGSYAAKYQSTKFGGNTPKGSTFARLQSQGTKANVGQR